MPAKHPRIKTLVSSRFSKVNLAIFIIIFAAIGGYAIFKSSAGSPLSANVWVSTTPGSCTRGTAAAFAASQSCSTLDAAYKAAQSGDIVGVAAGTYGAGQDIGYDASKTSAVTFIADPTGQVTFTGPVCLGNTSSTRCDGIIKDPASFVTLQGNYLYQGGLSVTYHNRQSTNVTIDGGHAQAGVSFGSVVNFTLKNIEFGPSCCGPDGIDIGFGNGQPIASNITIDGIYVHDIARKCADYPGPSADGIGPPLTPCVDNTSSHTDCLQIFGTLNNLAIKNSRFYNCATQGIFLGGSGPNLASSTPCAAPNGCYSGNILLENDMVGDVYEPGSDIIIGRGNNMADPSFAPGSTLTVRNVSTPGSINIRAQNPPVTIDMVNNILHMASFVACNSIPGATFSWSHNILSGQTCGPGDILANPASQFVNAGVMTTDLRLAGNSVAINAGDPANFPASDLFGNSRPVGGAPDIGAFEYGGTGGPPPTSKTGDINNDNSINILDLSILLSHYNQAATLSQGDLNNDNFCNISDLSILLSNWGK